jgi:hypothetical protein
MSWNSPPNNRLTLQSESKNFMQCIGNNTKFLIIQKRILEDKHLQKQSTIFSTMPNDSICMELNCEKRGIELEC